MSVRDRWSCYAIDRDTQVLLAKGELADFEPVAENDVLFGCTTSNPSKTTSCSL